MAFLYMTSTKLKNQGLILGFDAPVEQAVYLDRFMQGHELLRRLRG